MAEKKIVYLDNSATTPISEEALSAYVEASRTYMLVTSVQ